MTTIASYAALTACALLLGAQAALGFGTVRGAGQNAEHERITRHALACGLIDDGNCFQRKTLKELAGDDDDFGAIGIPDRGELVPENKAHCDSGRHSRPARLSARQDRGTRGAGTLPRLDDGGTARGGERCGPAHRCGRTLA